jgi:hypothetical protein
MRGAEPGLGRVSGKPAATVVSKAISLIEVLSLMGILRQLSKPAVAKRTAIQRISLEDGIDFEIHLGHSSIGIQGL